MIWPWWQIIVEIRNEVSGGDSCQSTCAYEERVQEVERGSFTSLVFS